MTEIDEFIRRSGGPGRLRKQKNRMFTIPTPVSVDHLIVRVDIHRIPRMARDTNGETA